MDSLENLVRRGGAITSRKKSSHAQLFHALKTLDDDLDRDLEANIAPPVPAIAYKNPAMNWIAGLGKGRKFHKIQILIVLTKSKACHIFACDVVFLLETD